jgi:3-hydroxybutyryl-CoA dehydrogenase
LKEAVTDLPRIAVIGAGRPGREFALSCLASGLSVVLEDVMPARLRQAEQDVAKLGEPLAHHLLQLVHTVEDAVRDADIAVDFMPDELESKLEIVSMIDRMAPPRTIICTPSEAMSIADLASCTYRGERCFSWRRESSHRKAEGGILVTHPPVFDATALEQVFAMWSARGESARAEMDTAPPMLKQKVQVTIEP